MKEKNTANPKRSLKSRFKKESRTQNPTIDEKEIDREQLVELLKQTADQEDRLEDLLIITPQPQKASFDPCGQTKDQDPIETDLTRSNSSPLDLDADQVKEQDKKAQFTALEEDQSAPESLKQQEDSRVKLDRDVDLVKPNCLKNRLFHQEREEDSNQDPVQDDSRDEADQIQQKDQQDQQEKRYENLKAKALKQERKPEKEIKIEPIKKQAPNIHPEEDDGHKTYNHQLKQNHIEDTDLEEWTVLPDQNVRQTNPQKRQEISHRKEELDPFDSRQVEQTKQNNRLVQDSIEQRQEYSKTQEKNNVHPHKIKQILHQWPTYFVLAAMVSIIFLLGKIYRLHFFKLSFAGMILGLGMIAIFIAIFGFYYMSKKIWKILAILLCVLVATQSLNLQQQLNWISASIIQMSQTHQPTTKNMGIYIPTHIPISSLDALDGETIGILAQRDDEGIHAILTSLAEQGIHVQTKSYASLQQLYKGAKGLAVRAVILNEADLVLIEDFAPSHSTTPPLTKVYSITMPAKTKPTTTSTTTKNLEIEPYTILISGSNDPLQQTAYRSNFNLLMTINPQTKQVLTTLIPRTLAVPTSCQEDNACPQGIEEERLSLVSYHSIEALQQSLEQTLDIPIDFTVRIDLVKLIELFDLDSTLRYQAADAVDSYIDIQPGQGDRYTIYQMKQLIGHVQDLAPDDLDQELTMLRIVKTILQAQALPRTKQIAPILELLQQAISTSFDANQLTQLIKTFLIFPIKMEEHYTWLQTKTTTQYSPALTEMLYMAKADPNSLESIQTAIHALLQANQQHPAKINVDPLPKPSTLESILEAMEQNEDPNEGDTPGPEQTPDPLDPSNPQELEQDPTIEGSNEQEQGIEENPSMSIDQEVPTEQSPDLEPTLE